MRTPMHRFKYTKLTKEQIGTRLRAAEAGPKSASAYSDVLNGKTVICNQEIPGITGGALDSREGEPGPIYLQGDHGPIEYRNIRITPAK